MSLEDCFHLGAKALLCSSEKKVLLLKKVHRTRGAFWELPGGRIQRGETLLEALRREIAEETGLRGFENVLPFDMVLTDHRILSASGEVGLVLSIYLCDVGPSFIPQISAEHTDFHWFDFDEAAEVLKAQYPSSLIEKISRL